MKAVSIWNKLRSEEKFLLFFSIVCLLLFYFTSGGSISFYDFFLLEAEAFTVSFNFFQGAAILAAAFSVYVYIKVFLEHAGILSKRGNPAARLKDLAGKARGLLRPLLFLLFGFSNLLIALSGITADVQGRIANEMLLGWDEAVFGVYPFIWLHTAANSLKPVFDFLSPLIIYSFQGLSLVIGATMIFFMKNRKIYPALVSSFFIAMGIGLFFWWAVPANSPNNYYLSVERSIPGYDPNRFVAEFEEKVRSRQQKLPPISTFPSSHVNWGMQIVFFWAVYDRRTLFVSVPWFLLMALGTVYLAQHYAVDILLGIPLGAVSIAAANLLVKRLSGGDSLAKPGAETEC